MFSCMGCRSKKKKKGDKDAKDKAPRKKSRKKKGGDKVSAGQSYVGLVMSRVVFSEKVVVTKPVMIVIGTKDLEFPVAR